MKNLILVLTIFILSSVEVLAQPTTTFPPAPDPSAIRKENTSLRKAIESSKNAQVSLVTAVDSKDSARINSANAALRSSSDDLADKQRAAISELIKQMQTGCTMVLWVEYTLRVEQMTQLVTSPYADEEIKNGFDRARDWGTILGVVAAAASFATNDSNAKKYVAAAGLSSASISQLLGMLFGEDTGKKVAEKSTFLALTVRAYDDLLARNNLLQSYIKSNENFAQKVEDLKQKYEEADDVNKLKFVKQTRDLLSNYEQVLSQYPELMKLYDELANEYIVIAEKEPALKESKLYKENLKPKLEKVIENTKSIQNFYRGKVEPALETSRTARELLLLAELQQAL